MAVGHVAPLSRNVDNARLLRGSCEPRPVVTAALAIALLAAAMAQATHAQEDSGGVADRLDELSAHVERANRINTILYVVSFAVGAGLAGIAISATHSNTMELREQVNIHEDHLKLLKGDIDDKATPVMAWTLAGKRLGRNHDRYWGNIILPVRVVNVGRAPAMRVTDDVTLSVTRNGAEPREIGTKHHAWGALPPNESIEIPVLIPEEELDSAEQAGGEVRADVSLEYWSVSGKKHSLKLIATHNGKEYALQDAEDWREPGCEAAA